MIDTTIVVIPIRGGAQEVRLDLSSSLKISIGGRNGQWTDQSISIPAEAFADLWPTLLLLARTMKKRAES